MSPGRSYKSPSSRRLLPMPAALSSVLTIGLLLGLSVFAQGAQPGGTPVPVPRADLERFEPSIRRQLLDAYDRATREPTAGTIGEIGILLHAYEHFEQAAACYGEARRLAPGTFDWPYLQAVALTMSGDIDTASVVLAEALSLEPGHVPARLRLADLYFDQGRLQEAEKLYRGLLGDRLSLARAAYGLGRLLRAQGDPDGVGYLEQAVTQAPDFGPALYALGQAYESRGDRTRAEALFQKYRNAGPGPSIDDALMDRVAAARSGPYEDLARGRRLLEQRRYREAIAALERAARLEPDMPQVHVNLVAAYAASGAAEKAEEAVRRAAALARHASGGEQVR